MRKVEGRARHQQKQAALESLAGAAAGSCKGERVPGADGRSWRQALPLAHTLASNASRLFGNGMPTSRNAIARPEAAVGSAGGVGGGGEGGLLMAG